MNMHIALIIDHNSVSQNDNDKYSTEFLQVNRLSAFYNFATWDNNAIYTYRVQRVSNSLFKRGIKRF